MVGVAKIEAPSVVVEGMAREALVALDIIWDLVEPADLAYPPLVDPATPPIDLVDPVPITPTLMLVVPDAGIDTSGPDTDASDPDTNTHGSATHDAGINTSDHGRDAYRDTYRVNDLE
ncbi:hypothetical protein SUGI_0510710 [Cryptomeria japonica]|nr:hypothetical protein SUGI_0510710 [Cryptomeria japonica]